MELGEGVSEAVARRSRGIARLVVRFLDRLQDAATVTNIKGFKNENLITIMLAEAVFSEFLKIDDRGLTKTDIKILIQLSKAEEPVGLDTLAVIANEDKPTLEHSVEPYLIQEGLLFRTKRGRILTDEGKRYLLSAGYINSSTNPDSTGRLLEV